MNEGRESIERGRKREKGKKGGRGRETERKNVHGYESRERESMQATDC